MQSERAAKKQRLDGTCQEQVVVNDDDTDDIIAMKEDTKAIVNKRDACCSNDTNNGKADAQGSGQGLILDIQCTCWNTEGMKNKLPYEDFIKYLKQFEIIALLETWLLESNQILTNKQLCRTIYPGY